MDETERILLRTHFRRLPESSLFGARNEVPDHSFDSGHGACPGRIGYNAGFQGNKSVHRQAGGLMRHLSRVLILGGLVAMAGAQLAAESWKVPAVTKKFPNGLVVVVSEDHSAPTFGLCISYRIGFRLEPEGRTGFAHLFEHMMFEGTPDAPKGTFDRVIEGGGVPTTPTRATTSPNMSIPRRFRNSIRCSGSKLTG